MSERNFPICVIVPCYNVEKYIARCLDSLLKQNIEVPYEIVVVDDGTKDKAAVIAEDYAAKHPNLIRVLHKENGGLSSARNFGIEHSDSEYLVFVDSDDYVSKDYLSTLYDSISRSGSDISMCGIVKTQNNDFSGKRFDSGFSEDCIIDELQVLISKSSFAAWNKMYRRSLFETIRYPDGITYEDYATTPRLFMKARKVVYVDRPCYYYYSNPESILGSMRKKIDWNILKAFLILRNSEISENLSWINILYERRVILSLAKTIISNGTFRDLKDLYKDMLNQGCISKQLFTKNLKYYDRFFVTLIKNGYLKCGYILQKSYGILRQIFLIIK